VVKVMYFDDAQPAFDARSPSLSFVAGVGALVTTLFFVFPAPIVGAAQAAAAVLFG
jgi:NADH-quinone oxidoreductase subunit N